jgi:integrase
VSHTNQHFEAEVDAMSKSSLSRRSSKSKSLQDAKPYPEFPLTAHPSGQWCKKHQGRQYYFGSLDDWESAFQKYEHEWPWIIAGKTPPPIGTGDGLRVADLCNKFLNLKRNRMESGELSAHSFAKYYETCELVVKHLGKHRRVDNLRPDDFEKFRAKLAKGCGVVTLKSKINRCSVVFKFAFDQRLIDRSVEYGRSFDRPSAKMLRQARNESGPRMFEAEELRRILDAADPIMRAMVLLGLNCGFGNTDVATLPQSAVDLDKGWVDFPRPKTAVQRRIPLWQETVDALRDALAKRAEPKDPADENLCFVTVRGTRFVRVQESKRTEGRFVTINSLARRFESLLKRLGINGRKGLGFYALRHGFETIGGESKDQVAVYAIMGHVDSSMAGVYRERISDERLKPVTETVRVWLWPHVAEVE